MSIFVGSGKYLRIDSDARSIIEEIDNLNANQNI
jgi:hypothetical protein